MPTLVVIDRAFLLPKAVVEPLVAADVLYWDTAGESWPKAKHLHLNPEMRGFDRLEKAVYRNGPKALPTAERAARMAKSDPKGHPWANPS